MKWIILLLFWISITSIAFGQRTRVVIIDTLTGTYAFDLWTDSEFDIDWDAHNKVDRTKYPNFIGHATFRKTKSKLNILIDDKRGYIELSNVVRSTKDTIYISKLHVFHNCTPDSVYTVENWYWENPTDTASELLKYISTEYKKEVTSKYYHDYATDWEKIVQKELANQVCVEHFPDRYSICINNQTYMVPLYSRWQRHPKNIVGHGRRPRDAREEYLQTRVYKPYKYFHFRQNFVVHALHAKVNLLPPAP